MKPAPTIGRRARVVGGSEQRVGEAQPIAVGLDELRVDRAVELIQTEVVDHRVQQRRGRRGRRGDDQQGVGGPLSEAVEPAGRSHR